MNRTALTFIGFIIVLSGALGFVFLTSMNLPETVASHFDNLGKTDGFMPRKIYLRLMMFIVFSVPVVLAAIPFFFIDVSGRKLNIPNKSYWLAPERCDGTVAYLRKQGFCLAFGVLIFLCYGHWLVVKANQLTPPLLSMSSINTGLTLLGIALFIWLTLLYGHFRVQK